MSSTESARSASPAETPSSLAAAGPAVPMADSAPVGIAAVDHDGRQTYVNAAFARMVGWSREELVGAMPPFVYWAPEGLPAIADAFERTLRGESPPEGFALLFQRRDGRRLDVQVHLGPFAGDRRYPHGWVAGVIDVSAEVAMRRALEQSEAATRAAYAAEREAREVAERSARQLAALQRATSDLTAALTPEEVADVVMRAAIPAVGGARGSVACLTAEGDALEIISFVGYPAEVIETYRRIPLDAPFPLTDAVRERQPILLPDAVARAARYGHLDSLLRSNGAGAMASLPLVVGDRVLGAIGINWTEDHEFAAEEATFLASLAGQCAQALERARLYAEEHRARAEAEGANRAKADFLAAMSHELRTPLNGIAGYVDLLELGIRGPLTPEQREDLARIRANQRHLASLIEDVLSFARIEAGKLEVERDRVAMDETLRALHPLVVPQLEQKGVRFVYGGCGPEVAARGDRERIVQICLNLLTNAAKATPPGGEVRLSCAVAGDRVHVQVIDTGVGIPPDKFEEIFSPFTQLGRALRAPREGAGLGLSISRGLAEAMGGSLTVESTVGRGSTFTLGLPVAPDGTSLRLTPS